LKCFTEEFVDQEKTGYKKAYEWFAKKLEKTKGNSQMHQINSKISSKLPSVAKFEMRRSIRFVDLHIPGVCPGHRHKSMPMLFQKKLQDGREGLSGKGSEGRLRVCKDFLFFHFLNDSMRKLQKTSGKQKHSTIKL